MPIKVTHHRKEILWEISTSHKHYANIHNNCFDANLSSEFNILTDVYKHNMYISHVCKHAQSTILIQGTLITKKEKKNTLQNIFITWKHSHYVKAFLKSQVDFPVRKYISQHL